VGNTVPGEVTKMLTLVPIIVAVYFFDLPKFSTIFTSPELLAFFVATASLLALGVGLKRKILAVRLELSRVSFSWGTALLALAALLYIYGSYTSDPVWYHYESLYVLVIAYVALRIGTGILRALAPLLAIFAFSFLPIGLFPDLLHRELVVFLSVDLITVCSLIYVGLRVRAAALPIAVLLLGLLGWYGSTFSLPIRSLYLDALIPLPLLILLIPRVRRFATLPGRGPTAISHEHHLLPDGFCSICGFKLARARTGENVGLWGFLAVVAVAILLILTTIPVLALTGNVPYDAYYTPHGYSGTVTPPTPAGWQVNSTAHYTSGNDFYAITQVYVPTFHPETKNYTMYYDLAVFAPPSSNGPFGIDIPGLSRTMDEFVQFGPFQGDLDGYVGPGTVFLAYYGTTYMLFLNGSTGQQYAVGLGFTREFRNSNITADAAQFLGDLNALWLPAITAQVSLSGWTNFLYGLDQGASSLSQFVLLASSMGIVAWAAYRVSLSDERLDRFLTIASVQPEEDWSYLSRLLKRPRHAGTGEELTSEAGPSGPASTERMESTLQELEDRQLITRSLIERGAEIVSVWKAAF
jgi:hypothetical protein